MVLWYRSPLRVVGFFDVNKRGVLFESFQLSAFPLLLLSLREIEKVCTQRVFRNLQRHVPQQRSWFFNSAEKFEEKNAKISPRVHSLVTETGLGIFITFKRKREIRSPAARKMCVIPTKIATSITRHKIANSRPYTARVPRSASFSALPCTHASPGATHYSADIPEMHSSISILSNKQTSGWIIQTGGSRVVGVYYWIEMYYTFFHWINFEA